MRMLRLALLVVLTLAGTASAQESSQPPYLATLEYTRFDLPHSVVSTCLVVFDDGRFQMGQISRFPTNGTPRFFEDSLPPETLKSLRTILEAREFQELKIVDRDTPRIGEGETLRGFVHHGNSGQQLFFTALDAYGGRPPKSFPAPLSPLVDWVQASTKAVKQRKLQPLKNTKATDCWLGGH